MAEDYYKKKDEKRKKAQKGGSPGLYANINAKRKAGKKMRKKGDPGAPSDEAFEDAAKTAKA